MRITITGATGFIGHHLLQSLRKNSSNSIRSLIRPNSPRKHRLLPCVDPTLIQEVDFENSEALCELLRGTDLVIHALGLINGSEEVLYRTNVLYTRHIASAAAMAGVKRIIYLSSVAAIRRHGYYGQTKYLAEQEIIKYSTDYLIFRPAFIYGAGDENNTALLIRTLKRFPIVPLLGGGNFRLQPVSVEDVCLLILQAILSSHRNKFYNVAGPAQISLQKMLKLISAELGVKRLFVPIPLKPVQDLMRLYLRCFPNTRLPAKQILELDKHEAFDISETQKDFNFHPMDFRQGVKTIF